jgi:TAG lipase / steryl ester hydrolase / phospholipase A2 / LPA acyltransferase
VPFVFLPTTILSKDPRTGEQGPWNPSQQYMDGSVDNDLPMNRLAEMFNVNHFIVSQVNPHVLPFIDREEELSTLAVLHHSEQATAESSGILGTLGGIAKSEILHRMHQLADLGVFPTTLTKIRSVVSQKYSGDITILPEIDFSMYPRVLQNPDPEFMQRALRNGERATWPKLSRISNHLAIELAIDKAIQRMRTKLAFSPSQVNLRMKSLTTSKHTETTRVRKARLYNQSRDKTQSWNPNPSLTHLSQLQAQFQLHPKPAAEENLRASMIDRFPDPAKEEEDSGAASDDEDTGEEGGFFLRLSNRLRRKRPLDASSPDPAPYDSNTSNLRSRSPSPTGSPDPITTAQTPKLWPISSRKGYISQPATPFPWKRSRRRSSPGVVTPSLKMTKSLPEGGDATTPKPMSEVEKKYKKLFHRK